MLILPHWARRAKVFRSNSKAIDGYGADGVECEDRFVPFVVGVILTIPARDQFSHFALELPR
jgi:hypothetical protein